MRPKYDPSYPSMVYTTIIPRTPGSKSAEILKHEQLLEGRPWSIDSNGEFMCSDEFKRNSSAEALDASKEMAYLVYLLAEKIPYWQFFYGLPDIGRIWAPGSIAFVSEYPQIRAFTRPSDDGSHLRCSLSAQYPDPLISPGERTRTGRVPKNLRSATPSPEPRDSDNASSAPSTPVAALTVQLSEQVQNIAINDPAPAQSQPAARFDSQDEEMSRNTPEGSSRPASPQTPTIFSTPPDTPIVVESAFPTTPTTSPNPNAPMYEAGVLEEISADFFAPVSIPSDTSSANSAHATPVNHHNTSSANSAHATPVNHQRTAPVRATPNDFAPSPFGVTRPPNLGVGRGRGRARRKFVPPPPPPGLTPRSLFASPRKRESPRREKGVKGLIHNDDGTCDRVWYQSDGTNFREPRTPSPPLKKQQQQPSRDTSSKSRRGTTNAPKSHWNPVPLPGAPRRRSPPRDVRVVEMNQPPPPKSSTDLARDLSLIEEEIRIEARRIAADKNRHEAIMKATQIRRRKYNEQNPPVETSEDTNKEPLGRTTMRLRKLRIPLIQQQPPPQPQPQIRQPEAQPRDPRRSSPETLPPPPGYYEARRRYLENERKASRVNTILPDRGCTQDSSDAKYGLDGPRYEGIYLHDRHLGREPNNMSPTLQVRSWIRLMDERVAQRHNPYRTFSTHEGSPFDPNCYLPKHTILSGHPCQTLAQCMAHHILAWHYYKTPGCRSEPVPKEATDAVVKTIDSRALEEVVQKYTPHFRYGNRHPHDLAFYHTGKFLSLLKEATITLFYDDKMDIGRRRLIQYARESRTNYQPLHTAPAILPWDGNLTNYCEEDPLGLVLESVAREFLERAERRMLESRMRGGK